MIKRFIYIILFFSGYINLLSSEFDNEHLSTLFSSHKEIIVEGDPLPGSYIYMHCDEALDINKVPSLTYLALKKLAADSFSLSSNERAEIIEKISSLGREDLVSLFRKIYRNILAQKNYHLIKNDQKIISQPSSSKKIKKLLKMKFKPYIEEKNNGFIYHTSSGSYAITDCCTIGDISINNTNQYCITSVLEGFNAKSKVYFLDSKTTQLSFIDEFFKSRILFLPENRCVVFGPKDHYAKKGSHISLYQLTQQEKKLLWQKIIEDDPYPTKSNYETKDILYADTNGTYIIAKIGATYVHIPVENHEDWGVYILKEKSIIFP